MLNIVKYLIIIRLRKILAKDDFFAIGLLIFFVTILCYLFQVNFYKSVNYLLLFLIQIIIFQIDRKDISLLKINGNFRIILYLEYFILSLPILILFLVNLKWLPIFVYLIIIFGITFIDKLTIKVFKYPFKMFDVFWTISFRKYKLFLLIPILGFVIYMSVKYQNQNLQYFVLLVMAIVLYIPTSEREKLQYIKASTFIGKAYLLQQVQVILYNSMFILVPFAVILLFLKQFQLLLFIPILLIFPLVNLLFKYVFFDRVTTHNIFFVLFIGCLVYGFPLIFVPFLYYKSIQNLKIIQNA